MIFKTIKHSLISLLFAGSVYAASPIIRESLILEKPPFQSCHASTVVELKNGELLCAFFAGEEEGAKGVGIWLTRYANGIWSSPKLVALDAGREPCWNPVLVSLDNEVLLFYKVGPNPREWSGVLKRSFDNGTTWQKEEQLPAGIYGPIKNKPFVTNDNTLVCGSSVESYNRWGSYIEISSDLGKSWEKTKPINLSGDYFGMIQPTIIKSSPNTLLLLARTRSSGYVAKAISKDNGRSFSEPELTNLPNSNSGIDAASLQDGRLLLVYNNSSTERTPLNIALSLDGGNSWKNVLALETGQGEFSYPAVIQKRNGEIVVTYTWNRTNIKAVILDSKSLGKIF